MTVAITMAAIIAIYLAASFYVKKATEYTEGSDGPWNRLYKATKDVIEDQQMPQEMVYFATAAVMCAGCGCLTRQILWDALLRQLGRRPQPPARRDPEMTDEQRKLFDRVVVNAIYYDSLRAPFMGFLLRRLVFPWLHAASIGTVPPKHSTLARMAKATRKAISHRPEGRRLLSGA